MTFWIRWGSATSGLDASHFPNLTEIFRQNPLSRLNLKTLKVLHILSQNELTGAEAYAIALIRRQLEAGHEVVIVSDTLTLPVPEGARYFSLPIDRRSVMNRLRNIRRVRGIIRAFGPRVVHAHSRAASWVARGATAFGPAFVSTIHGRQHWHTRFKLNDIYGERIIAVCGHLRDHIVRDFRISPRKVDLIRNLIESREYLGLEKKPGSPLRLGLFGRMSGPKGKIWGMLARDVLPDLMREFPELEILVGGGDLDRLSDEDREGLEGFLARHPGRARFFGRSPHLAREIAEVDFVIGSGRIAVESLFAGKRVYGFGEYRPVGWITRSSLRGALLSNFGDVGQDREPSRWWTPMEIWGQLRSGIRNEIRFDLAVDDVRHYFSETKTFRQIESVYRQAILKKRYPFGIPSLMFHKVVDGPFESKHRTFIPIRRLEKILDALRGLRKTPVTFGDLVDACEGKRTFPKRPILLTFDDGYRDTLELAAPALRERGMRATVYLLADREIATNEWDTRVDPSEPESPLLTGEERRALFETGAFEIGSHGLRHTALDRLPLAEREFEIAESKRRLEEEFGTEIRSFAYAYGNHSATDAETADRSGYAFAVGTDTDYGSEESLFRIFRANVFPEDGPFSIAKKSSVWYRRYFALKRKVREDRRNRTGAFAPATLRRRFAAAAVASGMILSFFLTQHESVVASIPRFRNVYGEVLEPCLPGGAAGFSFSDLCLSPSLAKSPTNICVERLGSGSIGTRFECVSPGEWAALPTTGSDYRTVWSSTNLRALPKLPADVARRFFPGKR